MPVCLGSQQVSLDGLGTFRVGLVCKLADTESDFTANNIKGYRIVYRPESQFTATGVNSKGHRTGFYTKTLLQGISSEPMPDSKAAVAEPSGDQ